MVKWRYHIFKFGKNQVKVQLTSKSSSLPPNIPNNGSKSAKMASWLGMAVRTLQGLSNVFWNPSQNLHPNPDLVSNCRKMQRDVGLIAASVGFGIFLLVMHLKLHPAIKKRVRIPGNSNLR